MTAREIDIHTLPSMLTALRLPSFHKLWQEIASRADTEGWPAARFLAVLAEYELAERDMRRIRRHLTEAQLPTGKTLATFYFKALPSLPRARVAALAAGRAATHAEDSFKIRWLAECFRVLRRTADSSSKCPGIAWTSPDERRLHHVEIDISRAGALSTGDRQRPGPGSGRPRGR